MQLKLNKWVPAFAEATNKRNLKIMGIFLLFFLGYQMTSLFFNHVHELNEELLKREILLEWMLDKDQEFKVQKNEVRHSAVSFLDLLHRKLEEAALISFVSEFKQIGENGLEVHFDKVEFDRSMAVLLAFIDEEHMVIQSLLITALPDSGLVAMTIKLKST